LSARAALQPGRHEFAALQPGDWFETGPFEVTGAMIDAYADLSGDRYALHTERAAARQAGFADRLAHGLLVITFVEVQRLSASVQVTGAVVQEWRWQMRKPVIAGSWLVPRFEFRDKKSLDEPRRGVLDCAVTVCDASDVVLSGRCLLGFEQD